MEDYVHNNKPVHEFGHAAMSIKLFDDPSIMKGFLERHADSLKTALNYITDMEYIGDVEYSDATADPLCRFSETGYRFKAASVGYKVLEQHFKCRKNHVPEYITMDFISSIIELYVQQQRLGVDDNE